MRTMVLEYAHQHLPNINHPHVGTIYHTWRIPNPRESSSDPATVVLNIFFEPKNGSRGGNLGHVQVTWLIFQAFQDLTITHY